MSVILTILSAFRAGEPWAKALGIVGALAATGVALWTVAGMIEGATQARIDLAVKIALERERAAIATANRTSEHKADAAERPVILCRGSWDRERVQCVP